MSTQAAKPREFVLRKKETPTLKSDYDAMLVMAEEDCDPNDVIAEKYTGHIRTIEKSAYDALLKELDESEHNLHKMHLQAELYLTISRDCVDKNSQLIAEIEELKAQLAKASEGSK